MLQMCARIKRADLATLRGIARGQRGLADHAEAAALAFVERVSELAAANAADNHYRSVCGNPRCTAVRASAVQKLKQSRCSRCLVVLLFEGLSTDHHWRVHKKGCRPGSGVLPVAEP